MAEGTADRRDPFVRDVAEALRDSGGVRPGDRVVVAVSGGADSVALLHALATIADQPQWALDLLAAHVNHRLRPEADEEERFCGELAATLGLRFASADGSVSSADNLEAAAREARYAALQTVAAERSADAIATAHHADDQLETLLLRLIRGASPRGMRGILPRTRLGEHRLIRPMLHVDHAAATAFLHRIGQSWCEDPSNADDRRDRARLRRDVLPALRAIRPDAAAKAVDTAGQLAAAEEALRRRARAVERMHLQTGPDGRCLHRDVARRLPDALLGRLLRRQAAALGAGRDALGLRTLRPILRVVRDGRGERRRFPLGDGVEVHVDRDVIRWTRRSSV